MDGRVRHPGRHQTRWSWLCAIASGSRRMPGGQNEDDPRKSSVPSLRRGRSDGYLVPPLDLTHASSRPIPSSMTVATLRPGSRRLHMPVAGNVRRCRSVAGCVHRFRAARGRRLGLHGVGNSAPIGADARATALPQAFALGARYFALHREPRKPGMGLPVPTTNRTGISFFSRCCPCA